MTIDAGGKAVGSTANDATTNDASLPRSGSNGALSQSAAAAADARLLKSIAMLVPAADDPDVMDALKQDYALRHKSAAPLPSPPWASRNHLPARLKAAALLALLYCVVLPLSMCAAAAHAAFSRIFPAKKRGTAGSKGGAKNGGAANSQIAKPRGTALVSGGNKTKALHVCRHLHRAGWRVVLVDGSKNWSNCSRFSNSVAKFYCVPIPNQRPLEYLKAMARIGARENVSLFVPVSIAQYSLYEALAAQLLPPGCHSCTLSAPDVALLNDKIKFQHFAEKHGLATPHVFPITSKDDLRRLNDRPEVFKGKDYLLKSVAYSAVLRADLFTLPCSPEELERYIAGLDISPAQAWLLQQFLQGPEYASYSVVAGPNVIAHADNVAELSCLNYEHVGQPEILKWVQKCCAAHPMDGQICFDFMLDNGDGVLYCIECNPRTSTNIVSFYDDPRLALAFFDPKSVVDACAAPLQPRASTRPVYWIYNELGTFLFSDLLAARNPRAVIRAASDRLRTIFAGVDAVADAADPLPFFALHFLQIPVQLVRILARGTPWIKIDLCSGKVVELGGD